MFIYLSKGNIPEIEQAGSLTQFLEQQHNKFGSIYGFWLKEIYIVSIASPELLGEVVHLFDRPGEHYFTLTILELLTLFHSHYLVLLTLLYSHCRIM